MTMEEFRIYIAGHLDRPPESVAVDAPLRTEVGLDSIEMFFLVIAVEDLGVAFPDQLLAHVVTLEDAYHHYVTGSGHQS